MLSINKVCNFALEKLFVSFVCVFLLGQQDTDLSDKGLNQARLVAQRLQMENFSHIFSSDLKRAYRVSWLKDSVTR